MTLDRRGFLGSIMACAAVIATGGRQAIGIELNPEYAEIARQRVEVAA